MRVKLRGGNVDTNMEWTENEQCYYSSPPRNQQHHSVSRYTRWLPVVLVSALVVWSYYVFVVKLVIQETTPLEAQIGYLVPYHFILFMFALCFLMTTFTPPGHTPEEWKLSSRMTDALDNAVTEEEWMSLLEMFVVQLGLHVHQRSVQGAIRYCDKCQAIKPDRAHHCSVCRRCVLKMDHHCPWVNNCIGFANYKYFFLFVMYAYFYCLILIISLGIRFSKYIMEDSPFRDVSLHYVILSIVCGLFSLFLTSLFCYHTYLLVKNRSTLEEYRSPMSKFGKEEKNLYDLGSLRNFQQVCGPYPILWCLPVSGPNGEGVFYPLNPNQKTIISQSTNAVRYTTVDTKVHYVPNHQNGRAISSASTTIAGAQDDSGFQPNPNSFSTVV